VVFAGDVTKTSDVEAMVATCLTAFGRIQPVEKLITCRVLTLPRSENASVERRDYPPNAWVHVVQKACHGESGRGPWPISWCGSGEPSRRDAGSARGLTAEPTDLEWMPPLDDEGASREDEARRSPACHAILAGRHPV
jgi:hypothetical protein